MIMDKYALTLDDYDKVIKAVENTEFDCFDEDIKCDETLKDEREIKVMLGDIEVKMLVECVFSARYDIRGVKTWTDFDIKRVEGTRRGRHVRLLMHRGYIEDVLSFAD